MFDGAVYRAGRLLLLGCWLALGSLAWGAEAVIKTPDGSEMVLVAAGEFTMGSEGKARDEDKAEAPIHKVTLPAYYIDKTEVTCEQYCRFLNEAKPALDAARQPFFGLPQHLPIEQAGGKWQPRKGHEKLPMTNVTWYGAQAYAAWAGKRLPTEAEWEKAARGAEARKYPWGDTLEMSRLQFGPDKMVPVGSFPTGASPYGCLDMAGNAWEWTSSQFKPYPYVATDGREKPDGGVERRVARGGSFGGEPNLASTTYRFRPFPDFAHRYLGFRCAKNAQ